MTDYSVRTITKTIFEVSLPNPTNGEQLDQALHVAATARKKYYGDDPVYDNTFTVTADESAIRIQWDGPEETVGGIH